MSAVELNKKPTSLVRHLCIMNALIYLQAKKSSRTLILKGAYNIQA